MNQLTKQIEDKLIDLEEKNCSKFICTTYEMRNLLQHIKNLEEVDLMVGKLQAAYSKDFTKHLVLLTSLFIRHGEVSLAEELSGRY